MPATISPRHLVCLILGALLIGFSPIFAVMSATGEGSVGTWDSAFWRAAIGAAAIGIVFGARGELEMPKRVDFRKGLGWIWLPGLVFALDFWAWHWSFENTSVANSTLLANTSILWVTLFAWLVWKERIGRTFVFGAMIAFAGMALLMLSSSRREPPVDGDAVFGDCLALLTAVFYAIYQLLMKLFRRQHSAQTLMFWASLVAALFLFPLALVHDDPLIPTDAMKWLPLIGLGVLSHAGGQGLIAYGLGGIPASLATVTLLVQPVATAFLGLWILGQDLVFLQVVGAGIVLAGLFFAIRGQVSHRGKSGQENPREA